jgi:nitroreductase/SAM-dependent methyltransferase
MAAHESTSDDPVAPSSPTASSSTAGIPDVAEGTPSFGEKRDDADEGAPIGPTPPFDFWRAIYTRRSIRKFKPDRVPRELVDQVMHAGIWAPSSCNYQMWDLVAVDEPEVNEKLAALSLQMSNAPVNIVVSYGRDFSEDGWANIQSASAAIQNMSLAAHVLGLGTFWITQMGDREKVREIVGLPEDRLVVAVLALGYPKLVPKKGPKRRPMAHVTHHNYYAGRPIPSSANPADWDGDLLAVYQRARVLNGLRHNKPRAWEERAIIEALDVLMPSGRAKHATIASSAPMTTDDARATATSPSASSRADGAAASSVPSSTRGSQSSSTTSAASSPRWLDVLPCTGIVTERLWRERPSFTFDVVERTREVAEFVSLRTRPHGRAFGWSRDAEAGGLLPPPDASFDVVSSFFRLENVAAEERAELVASMSRWLKPDGRMLIAFVSKSSFHDLTEWLRNRRGGLRGVEYVLSPDPNIGPFESLLPGDVETLCASAGLRVEKRFGCQAVPQREEIEFRTRNFSERGRSVARTIGWTLERIEKLPGLRARRGRFQFLSLKKS